MLSSQKHFEQLDKLKNLSLNEKILLVEDLWDEIASSNQNIPVTDEQKKQLELRLITYQSSSKEGRSWDVVREDIKSKL